MRISGLADNLSSSAAPSRNSANTSGPNARDNTAPPTEEVEENKEAEAEVVEEEKVDQEDQIKILQGEVDKWKNDYY